MFAAEQIEYNQTGYFSKIVLDYLDQSEKLRPYYTFSPDLKGIRNAIEAKKKQPLNRSLLVDVIKEQYSSITLGKKLVGNIEKIGSEKTFTICTAHQPNLFTGPLYFIYKILHAIKLADYLNEQLNDYNFVPVYYMGSEDADFEELNHFKTDGKLYEWTSDQKGPVGRMKVDKALVSLINELDHQIHSQPFGPELITLLKHCFQLGRTVQEATLLLVNELFGKMGLVVLIADHPKLKETMVRIFEEDLWNHKPATLIKETIEEWDGIYKVQAQPRLINLFYLKDGSRERIELKEGRFQLVNTEVSFSEDEFREQLNKHPERFSPNVILRALFQEAILPNITFIGGGGELAYWLQMKRMFDHYSIVFPVLLLRNSFLLINSKQKELISKLQLNILNLFKPELDLMNLVLERLHNKPELNGQVIKLEEFYTGLKEKTTSIDHSLNQYVEALKIRSIKQLKNLEKKMQRAERKKHEALNRQVSKLKQWLFPGETLQERKESFISFYAQHGPGFLLILLEHSPHLENKFTILTELKSKA